MLTPLSFSVAFLRVGGGCSCCFHVAGPPVIVTPQASLLSVPLTHSSRGGGGNWMGRADSPSELGEGTGRASPTLSWVWGLHPFLPQVTVGKPAVVEFYMQLGGAYVSFWGHCKSKPYSPGFLLAILLIFGSSSTCLFLPLISFQTGTVNRAVIVNPSQYPILSMMPGTRIFLIHRPGYPRLGSDKDLVSSHIILSGS